MTTAPVTVASVTAADADYVVDTNGLATLAPGATGTFTETFAPLKEGAIASTVAVTLAGATTPELSIALTGTGAARPSVGGCSTGGGGATWPAWLAVVGLVVRRRRAGRVRS